MRRILNALVSLMLVSAVALMPASAFAKTHYENQGGHYKSGHGSSHKGGHYKNKRTGDHYTHHKS